MSNLNSDVLDRTALAALNTIAAQAAAGEITGPEAQARLQAATRLVAEKRYEIKSRQIVAEMLSGEISPVIAERRLATVAREAMAITGEHEALS